MRDVGFEVESGTCLGIIGENGSGKSTLLRMGRGGSSVQPRVTCRFPDAFRHFWSWVRGFNPEFTGRDNVFLNASILGLTDEQTRERMPSIEEFADIGEFVDRPVKTYSTGMVVRLAFAVAIHMDPVVLIVDEALSVGDMFFQQRCMRKIHALKAQAVTILFVSHDLAAVRALADQTLWMEHGAMKMIGPTDEVTSKYLAAMVTKGSLDMGEEAPHRRRAGRIIRSGPVSRSSRQNSLFYPGHAKRRPSLRKRKGAHFRHRDLQSGRAASCQCGTGRSSVYSNLPGVFRRSGRAQRGVHGSEPIG